MPYDASREALYHPESKPVFVDVDRMPEFEAGNPGHSLVNAWWLSNAAHLAYYEASAIEHQLCRVGLRFLGLFCGESTQAYLAASEAFAILAFRGTQTDQLADLKVDADIRLAPFHGQARVHRGFLAALDEVWTATDEKLKEVAAQGLPIWYTGHSLGAALATLAAARRKPAALYSFASPRVGNGAFARSLDDVPMQRIVNCCDVIPAFPPHGMGYRHAGALNFITAGGKTLIDPWPSRVLWSKAVGIGRFFSTLPWLRRGIVKARSLADHATVNYTAALAAAIPRRSKKSCVSTPHSC